MSGNYSSRRQGDVLAFDNLSGVPPWLSDTLCRLTSGGAFSTRRLFTDQDESLMDASWPITHGSRISLLVPIERIAHPGDDRREPSQRQPRCTRSSVVGRSVLARLDAAAHGLHMLPQLRIQHLPRMADFALWATARETRFDHALSLPVCPIQHGQRRWKPTLGRVRLPGGAMGGNASDRPRQVAEAQIDLRRVRYARHNCCRTHWPIPTMG